MATTTPNFGWSVPTSTDLVKDGATAIETLGDAIDASLVDLKGGTTGQVLSKNSGTDMDFAWITDATGMANPMTTTGDTIYSSSGSTPARLGIGTTGQVLTVAGGVPSWATSASGSLTLLSTTTLTGTSVSVTGISGSYTNLQIRIDDLGTGTTVGVMKMGLNSNTTSYLSCGVDGGAGAVFTGGGSAYIPLTANRNMKDTGGDNTAALVNVYNYAGTNAFKVFDVRTGCTNSGGGDSVTNGSGVFQSTSAVTSVQVVITNGATFDGGPSMKIYGVN